jgi:hypothetical protein
VEQAVTTKGTRGKYKEEPNSYQKIGNYLNRPEYKFQSKHATTGTLYWVKKRVE